jgi:hypothetical protein
VPPGTALTHVDMKKARKEKAERRAADRNRDRDRASPSGRRARDKPKPDDRERPVSTVTRAPVPSKRILLPPGLEPLA